MSRKSLPPYTIEKVVAKDRKDKYVSVYANVKEKGGIQELYEAGELGEGFDTRLEAIKDNLEFESYLV